MLVYTSDSDAQLEASSNNEHDVEASRHIDLSFRARTSFCFAPHSRVSPSSHVPDRDREVKHCDMSSDLVWTQNALH